MKMELDEMELDGKGKGKLERVIEKRVEEGLTSKSERKKRE